MTDKARKRPPLTVIRRDGSSTVIPDHSSDEMDAMMRQAGLGALVEGNARGINPMDLLAGMMKFEMLAGIRHTEAPAAVDPDVFDGEIDFGADEDPRP